LLGSKPNAVISLPKALCGKTPVGRLSGSLCRRNFRVAHLNVSGRSSIDDRPVLF
jgi:hypothetical protein